jgi:regulator of replication initiation timing
MTTQINRQSMIAQAIKLGFSPRLVNTLDDKTLTQLVCNRGGVIISKSAVVANVESHIQKDTIIAQLRVENHALASQPQVNSQQLADKNKQISSLSATKLNNEAEISKLKQNVKSLTASKEALIIENKELMTELNKKDAIIIRLRKNITLLQNLADTAKAENEAILRELEAQ